MIFLSLGSLFNWVLIDLMVWLRCLRDLIRRFSLGGDLLKECASLRAVSLCSYNVSALLAVCFA